MTTIKVTSTGPSVTCPDREGAVDADVTVGDMETSVTLLPAQYDGRLSTWGQGLDQWASGNLASALGAMDDDERAETIDAIVEAVRAAVK